MNQSAVLTKPTENTAQPVNGLIAVTMQDLEAMIRRVVEEAVDKAVHNAVQKELQQAKLTRPLTIGEDWSHEGPDDPEGDAELLAEALVALEEYKKHPERLMSWEDFQLELEAAEARGELPR